MKLFSKYSDLVKEVSDVLSDKSISYNTFQSYKDLKPVVDRLVRTGTLSFNVVLGEYTNNAVINDINLTNYTEHYITKDLRSLLMLKSIKGPENIDTSMFQEMIDVSKQYSTNTSLISVNGIPRFRRSYIFYGNEKELLNEYDESVKPRLRNFGYLVSRGFLNERNQYYTKKTVGIVLTIIF